MFKILINERPGSIYETISMYNSKITYLLLNKILSKLQITPERDFSVEILKIPFRFRITGEIQDINNTTLQNLYSNLVYKGRNSLFDIQEQIYSKITLLPTQIAIIEGSFGSGKTKCFEFFADRIKNKFSYYIPFKIINTYTRIKYEFGMIELIRKEFKSVLIFFDDFDHIENTLVKEKVLKFIIKNYDSNLNFILTTTKDIHALNITDLFPLIHTKIIVSDQKCLFNVVSSLIMGKYNSVGMISDIAESLVGLHIREVIDIINKSIYLNNNKGNNNNELLDTVRNLVKFYRKTSSQDDVTQLTHTKKEAKQTFGYKEEKEAIYKIIEYPIIYKEFYKELKLKAAKGILLFGPPGCSKTTMVKEIASTNKNKNKYFVHIKGPEFYNKYVGKSEQKLSEVFMLARRYSPSILFFDEIDSIASSRNNANKACSRILGQLLVELDGIEGLDDVLFIAATNNPDKIDDALLRKGRIDEIIYLGPPNENSRLEILRNLMDKKLLSKIDTNRFVKLTKNFTGAELQFLINEINITGLGKWENIVKEQNIICTKDVLKHYQKWNRNHRKFII